MAPDSSIVVNTSPWIALSLCGQTSLLPEMYRNIYLPEAVRDEILAGGEQGFGMKEIHSAAWLQIASVQDKEKVDLLYELDKGEAEVILLAREKEINQVLIDEKVARLQAKALGLEVIGTLGLLLKAKKQGKLQSIKPFIELLLENGIWIHESIVQGILKDAGEI